MNYAFLMNQDAQVHLHVVPRYSNSRLWGARTFTDAHWGESFGHDQNLVSMDEMKALAVDIAAALPDHG